MQVAIDKTCLKYLDKVKGNELIYIFDDEPLEELLKLNMHCVHKSKIKEERNITAKVKNKNNKKKEDK